MDNSAIDRQSRAMTGSAISRDFQQVTFIGVISNLVTLYIISEGTEAIIATSAVIITTAVFVFLAGNNAMAQFRNWIADMDEQEIASHSGQYAKADPFGLWKATYSICFIALAVAQLYELWV